MLFRFIVHAGIPPRLVRHTGTGMFNNDIQHGLRRIDAGKKESGIIVDLCIYGGAALALMPDIRCATRAV
ncbi:MAG: hypothetical protein ACYDHM_10970 [Acidiferrobacterales bacterium]